MNFDLPWLERPTQEDRERLKFATSTSSDVDAEGLRRLVTRDWSEVELRSIGRAIRRYTRTQPIDGASTGQNEGPATFSLLLISQNTVTHLVDALIASSLRVGILLDCRTVEYQEPETWLAENRAKLSAAPPSASMYIPDRTSLNLNSCVGDPVLAAEGVNRAVDRVKRIADQLHEFTGRSVILQTLAVDVSDSQLSMDAWLPGSPRRILAAFNEGITQYARERSFPIFDVAAIADFVGAMHWSAGRYWYVAKLPFAPAFIPLYSYRLVQLLATMLGKSRRVLVLDLDNTLWGGLIGDDGIEGLTVGLGSARGETYLAVQRLALDYKRRGIILCIASKNTESIARDAFVRHPGMLLRESDIALFQINWRDKATNISAMADALSLGLDAFVFLDDNPAERKQVRDALPLVAVPELPSDPSEWPLVFQAAAYFEQLNFSAEDQGRTEFYRGNALRDVQAKTIGNHEEYLQSLHMIMTVTSFEPLGRTRIAQLISKSNQFNLTTRRYSESEIAGLEEAPEYETMQIRLEDMFGDNGMISVVICRKLNRIWEIDTWIMSCRVLGRGIEQATLRVLVDHARAANALELRGTYLPTAKNGLVRDHYAKLGFVEVDRAGTSGTTWKLVLSNYLAWEGPIEIREPHAAADSPKH